MKLRKVELKRQLEALGIKVVEGGYVKKSDITKIVAGAVFIEDRIKNCITSLQKMDEILDGIPEPENSELEQFLKKFEMELSKKLKAYDKLVQK
jgi:isopropylmalate/homocitrate/citramalate synthase